MHAAAGAAFGQRRVRCCLSTAEALARRARRERDRVYDSNIHPKYEKHEALGTCRSRSVAVGGCAAVTSGPYRTVSGPSLDTHLLP